MNENNFAAGGALQFLLGSFVGSLLSYYVRVGENRVQQGYTPGLGVTLTLISFILLDSRCPEH